MNQNQNENLFFTAATVSVGELEENNEVTVPQRPENFYG